LKTLVLCVDRDNDIGEKAKIEGPVIGYEDNLKAAQALGLADLYEAVKTAKLLNTEVVTLTGDTNVGLVSDEKISKQIDMVMERFKPESVILITDGAEDEQVIPIIQSRVKINAIRTVIVRQSRELEKAYFKITNFLKEVEKDSSLAHLIFVIPGLILLLIAIGGALNMLMPTMLILLAGIGLYLIVKGLGIEEEFFGRINEFMKSLSIERISIVAYLLAVVIFILGIFLNYQEYLEMNPQTWDTILMTILNLTYINVVLLSFVTLILGRIIDEYSMEKYLTIRFYIILLALIVFVTFTAQSVVYYLEEQSTLTELLIVIALSIIFFFVIVKGTALVFIEELNIQRKLRKQYEGKKVVNKEGTELGKVTKVLVDNTKFLGIKVGRKRIEKDDILSHNAESIIIQEKPIPVHKH
jgi:putative membrane protein